MRAVVQRVRCASVSVGGKIIGKIGHGLLVFLGIGKEDLEADLLYTAEKMINLRIFADDRDKMNLSLRDVQGQLLIISQFTLYGDCRKGRRPAFDHAMPPDEAEKQYERFIAYCRQLGIDVQTGQFGADMQVESCNDGPVTMLIDSKKSF